MLRGIYAITDSGLLPTDDVLFSQVAAALKGGANIIQYRNKSTDKITQHRQARGLQDLCREYSTPLIINDNIELALQIDADGIHLGQQDISLPKARQLLGHKKIIGITCHGSLALAETAQQQSANYAAFGACFTSPTKPTATTIDLTVLQQAKTKLRIPIVAIGGINSENAPLIIATAVDMIAVVSSIFSDGNTYVKTQHLSQLFRI